MNKRCIKTEQNCTKATNKAILISIRDHEVTTSTFPTYEKAFDEMERALCNKINTGEEDGSSGPPEECKLNEDYGIETHTAWLNNYSNYDWIIVDSLT